MTNERTVTVALVQDGTAVFDTPKTLEKVADWCEQASSAGADMILFPEAFVGGYPKGIEFGLRLGSRSPEGRAVFRRYFDSAIAQGGTEHERLSKLAKQHGLYLTIGVVERIASTLHCAIWFFEPNGKLANIHRKLMPTALERCVWGMADGSTMPVFDSPLGRIGGAICWENYMPLYRAHLYSKGIELYCAPTVDDRDQWLATMTHVALEGRCFVMSACQFLTRADMPADLSPIQGDDPDTIMIRGGSCIVSPLGEVLVEPEFGTRKLISIQIDLNQLAEARFDLDVVGHYSRPDIFSLTVDESVKSSQAISTSSIPAPPMIQSDE
jgi:nitrilase